MKANSQKQRCLALRYYSTLLTFGSPIYNILFLSVVEEKILLTRKRRRRYAQGRIQILGSRCCRLFASFLVEFCFLML